MLRPVPHDVRLLNVMGLAPRVVVISVQRFEETGSVAARAVIGPKAAALLTPIPASGCGAKGRAIPVTDSGNLEIPL